MAEWGGLENRYTRKGIEGSNPSLSANRFSAPAVAGQDWFTNGVNVSLTKVSQTSPESERSERAMNRLKPSLQGSPQVIPLSPPSLAEASFGGQSPLERCVGESWGWCCHQPH